MEKIDITRKDVIWSYIAKFFQIGSGFLTLPIILHMLTPEEVGMNYLMLTVSSMVALLDFGFAPQFGRNFTYINSGAQKLLKEGVEYSDSKQINYHLLSVLLKTAKAIYKKLSLLSLSLMLTAGTVYIYYVTKGFTNVRHAFLIWLLFSVSTYCNIYFTYYSSLLTGSGKVAEQNIGTILSRFTYILICVLLLILKFGLFSIVIANFISPFIFRLYCHAKYFTKELVDNLDEYISKAEINEMFSIIWFNAKKLGINFIGAYAINKSAMFIMGFYLPLNVIGSYGLLIQLTSIIQAIASTLFITYQPKFSSCRVTGDKENFKILLSLTTITYFILMSIGSFFLFFFAPKLLELVDSKTLLPPLYIQIMYVIAITLEGNHSNFATLIVTNNTVPFVKAAITAGIAIIIITVLALQFSDLGLFGVVLTQFVVQLSYNNWKWPKWILNEFDLKILDILKYSYREFNYLLRK